MSAESLTTQTETQLVAEKRGREEERREREEKLWELTRQLQALKELQTQTQAKVFTITILCLLQSRAQAVHEISRLGHSRTTKHHNTSQEAAVFKATWVVGESRGSRVQVPLKASGT